MGASSCPRKQVRPAAIRYWLGATAVMLLAALPVPKATAGGTGTYRAFTSNSYWNTRLTAGVPNAANSWKLRAKLVDDNTDAKSPKFFIHLAGTEADGGWGEPVYWARRSDPLVNVTSLGSGCGSLPDEFVNTSGESGDGVPIPEGAEPAATGDAPMTVYDLDRGRVFHLQGVKRTQTGGWKACGGAIYYLGSNGLHKKWAGCGAHPRNTGHRGLPPSTYAVRHDEILAGAIEHRLKIAVDNTKATSVFPMSGSDGNGGPVPQGALLRIKAGVDLSSRLSGAALTIARALKEYGAVIGDQSGGYAVLKLENPVAEGADWRWTSGPEQYRLYPNSLKPIPTKWFRFVKMGYKGKNCSGAP